MKKTLTSIIAVAMAMTMTTSAFAAAVARTIGDVDGDGQITANDVYLIETGKASADVNNDLSEDGLDSALLYRLVLQPKTVTEKLKIGVETSGLIEGKQVNSFGMSAADLAGDDSTTDEYGTTVVLANDVNKGVTVHEAFDKALTEIAATKPDTVSTNLDNIWFNSVKGQVYLRKDDGWAMFNYALRYIVPFGEEDAKITNKAAAVKESADWLAAHATPEEVAARAEAFAALKAVIVSEGDFAKADVEAIRDNICKAIPGDLDEETIAKTAEEVLKIVETRFDVKTGSVKIAVEDQTSKTVSKTEFFKGVVELLNYDNTRIYDVRQTFGDTIGVQFGHSVGIVGLVLTTEAR